MHRLQKGLEEMRHGTLSWVLKAGVQLFKCKSLVFYCVKDGDGGDGGDDGDGGGNDDAWYLSC